MSELIGYAYPVWRKDESRQLLLDHDHPVPERWDHTYVASSEDDRWGCHGGSTGGREICRGRGDLEAARCLACKDGRAGLTYGLHGICHQMANRIMWPARIRVTRARGYTFFSFIYGHYGRLSKWHERSLCLGDHDDMPSFEHRSNGLEEAAAPFDHGRSARPPFYGVHGDLDESSAPAPMNPNAPKDYSHDERLNAFKEAMDDRLGSALDLAKRKRLLAIQIDSLGPQDELALAFENKKISPEAYFQEFSTLHRACMEELESVLGREDFIRLFDFPLEDMPPPADPTLFAKAHGLARPPKTSS